MHKLGDIIRVHRAEMKVFKNKRQFNVNLFYSGSYALFSTERSITREKAYTPYASSGTPVFWPNIEREDIRNLKSLRSWSFYLFKEDSKVYIYSEIISHLKNECPCSKIYACPLKCQDPSLMTKAELKEHLLTKCPNMTVQCSTCSQE